MIRFLYYKTLEIYAFFFLPKNILTEKMIRKCIHRNGGMMSLLTSKDGDKYIVRFIYRYGFMNSKIPAVSYLCINPWKRSYGYNEIIYIKKDDEMVYEFIERMVCSYNESVEKIHLEKDDEF